MPLRGDSQRELRLPTERGRVPKRLRDMRGRAGRWATLPLALLIGLVLTSATRAEAAAAHHPGKHHSVVLAAVTATPQHNHTAPRADVHAIAAPRADAPVAAVV